MQAGLVVGAHDLAEAELDREIRLTHGEGRHRQQEHERAEREHGQIASVAHQRLPRSRRASMETSGVVSWGSRTAGPVDCRCSSSVRVRRAALGELVERQVEHVARALGVDQHLVGAPEHILDGLVVQPLARHARRALIGGKQLRESLRLTLRVRDDPRLVGLRFLELSGRGALGLGEDVVRSTPAPRARAAPCPRAP